MGNSSTIPDVEQIISTLRQGMDDTTPLLDSHPEMNGELRLKSGLRRAAETSDILGRCSGSLRGRICSQLARIALPVVEQINLHHNAVVDSLNGMHESRKNDLEARIHKLEKEVETLKAGSDS